MSCIHINYWRRKVYIQYQYEDGGIYGFVSWLWQMFSCHGLDADWCSAAAAGADIRAYRDTVGLTALIMWCSSLSPAPRADAAWLRVMIEDGPVLILSASQDDSAHPRQLAGTATSSAVAQDMHIHSMYFAKGK